MANNIFSDIPPNFPKEIIETLVDSPNVKIERIVSKGDKSPEDFWYEQEKNEFVIVLKGEGRILFENGEEISLTPGEYINIQAMKKHRVTFTKEDEETVWLVVFY